MGTRLLKNRTMTMIRDTYYKLLLMKLQARNSRIKNYCYTEKYMQTYFHCQLYKKKLHYRDFLCYLQST